MGPACLTPSLCLLEGRKVASEIKEATVRSAESLGLAMKPSHGIYLSPTHFVSFFFSQGLEKAKQGETTLESCSNEVIVCGGFCCPLNLVFFCGYFKSFFPSLTIFFSSRLCWLLVFKKTPPQTNPTLSPKQKWASGKLNTAGAKKSFAST